MRSWGLGLGALWLVGGSSFDAAVSDANDAGDTDASCLSVSSYATSCATATDCVVVFVGSVCDFPCFCPNATISASDKAHYDSAFAATGHGESTCFCAPDPIPLCCQGVCTIGGCDAGP